MVFQSHTNYLSSKIQIHFENEGVMDMLGEPNTGTSYSLPGHIMISLPALPAPLQGRLREVKDLKIVMEGKSEFWDDHGRYTPMRLHTTTLILASPSKPLLIPSSDPARPHARKLQLAVAFDMRIPGWLPPSHDSEMTTVSYGLIAHATIGWGESPSSSSHYACPSSSSFSSSSSSSIPRTSNGDIFMDNLIPSQPLMCKPKSSKSLDSIFGNHSLLARATEKSSSEWSPFTVRRHRLPSSIGSSSHQNQTERHYTLKPEANSNSPLECIVTVPDWVDVNGDEKSLKVSLRVRARNINCNNQPMEIDSVHTRNESSSSRSSSSSITSIAATSNPTLGSRELESVPMERQYGDILGKRVQDDMLTHILELGMEVEETERFSSNPSQSFTSSFPIPAEQPARNSTRHQLISPGHDYADGGLLSHNETPFRGIRRKPCLLANDGNQRNFFFSDEGLGLGEKWRKINVVLPMPSTSDLVKNPSSSRPQSEMDSPFLRIRHDLKIRVVCRNAANPNGTQVVILSTPIKFGTCPSTMPDARPDAVPLPAYIQLFHENGDLRECDALPIYTKSDLFQSKTSSEETSTTESTSLPNSPTPSYASLYPLTTKPYLLNSSSNYTESDNDNSSLSSSAASSSSTSLSTLNRRNRSSSPALSSGDESMDIDGVISSDADDEDIGGTGSTTSVNTTETHHQATRKVGKIPRAIRALA
ncbi:uncharacterized protein L201_002996 [Kwoniella dendrophila CBS 6074]|uniref:Arrestin C-terminal-like domain-containing protein n=1 Tax=Kwoniella dendrophila CBS 6074 TaxID=1295534 RepID=A0AAX4JU64_9TREE